MIFIPHEYQKYTIDYIKSHPVAAAFLDCGLGKTVISLSALKDLIDAGEIKKALVIAPLRVARDVWPAEAEKWLHLKGLKISVILGTPKQREAALQADAQIYVINRDNLSWLVSQKWPIYMFDTVVLDELSSFKNMRAARTRAAYRLCREAKRVIGLTGTPASNGLMDLWAEYAVMDGGEHLGNHLNSYQLKYFNPVFGYQGKIVDWKPREGSEEKIYEAISDITISMKAMDHLQMPEKVVTDYVVRLSEKEKALYEKLTAEMEGIFLWCFSGLQRLVENRFRFTISERAKENLREAEETGNNIRVFMTATEYISFGSGKSTTSLRLYQGYQMWCRDNADKPVSMRSFGSFLKQNASLYGIKADNNILNPDGKRVRGFHGIRVDVSLAAFEGFMPCNGPTPFDEP